MADPQRVGRRPGSAGEAARLRGDGGIALVETAIVAPLLLALFFGIVDSGFAFNDYISLRQGSREATRQAVTGRVGTDDGCSVVSSSTSNASVKRLVCLTKHRVDLPAEDVRVKINIEGSYAERRSLQVCVMVKLNSVSGIYSSILDDIVVQSAVQMRTEQTTWEAAGTTEAATPGLSNFSETPFSGQTFSCTLKATS
jgi:hypothetical protein